MAAHLAAPLLSEAEASRSATDARRIYDFVEGRSARGQVYQTFTVSLIALNVVAFVTATVFNPKYNPEGPYTTCAADGCRLLDAFFFGNADDNGLLGTSVLEIFTVAVFSADYVARFYVAPEADAAYSGVWGRVLFVFSFYSLVDLLSTLPFYVDFFTEGNLPASQALRTFRLFRIMRLEGKYVESFTLLDDLAVEIAAGGLLKTAGFIGCAVWVVCSALYYLAERHNPAMIYCPSCPDVDTSLCETDGWGVVDCAAAGCSATKHAPRPCAGRRDATHRPAAPALPAPVHPHPHPLEVSMHSQVRTPVRAHPLRAVTAT